MHAAKQLEIDGIVSELHARSADAADDLERDSVFDCEGEQSIHCVGAGGKKVPPLVLAEEPTGRRDGVTWQERHSDTHPQAPFLPLPSPARPRKDRAQP